MPLDPPLERLMRRTLPMALMAELGLVEGELRWMGAVELTFWCSERLVVGTNLEARLDLGGLERHVDMRVKVSEVGDRYRRGYLHAGRWQLANERDRRKLEDRIRSINPDFDLPREAESESDDALPDEPPDEDESTDLANATRPGPSRRRRTARIVQQEYDLFEGTQPPLPSSEPSESSGPSGGTRAPRRRRSHRRLEAASVPPRQVPPREWTLPGAGRRLDSVGGPPGDDDSTDLTGGASAEATLPPRPSPPSPSPSPFPQAHLAPGSPPHLMVPLTSTEAVRGSLTWAQLRLRVVVAPVPELGTGDEVQLVLQLPDLTFHQLPAHVIEQTGAHTALQTGPLDRRQLAPVRVHLE